MGGLPLDVTQEQDSAIPTVAARTTEALLGTDPAEMRRAGAHT